MADQHHGRRLLHSLWPWRSCALIILAGAGAGLYWFDVQPQPANSLSANPTSNGPRLVLPRCPLDLGTGTPGETLRACIPIENAGNQPLLIKRAETTCGGCSSLRLAKSTVDPGESVDLEIAVTLKTEGEQRDFQIAIHSNDTSTPIAAYSISARVPAILVAAPAQVAFGTLQRGSSARAEILVRYPDGKRVCSPREFEVKAARGLVRIIDLKTVEKPMAALLVTIEAVPDLPPGDLMDTICVRPVGSTRAIEVPVSGWVVTPILISPTNLYFGSMAAAGPVVTRRVLVRRSDGRPLARPSRSLTPPGVDVRELQSSGGQKDTRRLVVGVNPSRTTPELDEWVSLWFEDEPEPVRIRIVGYVRQ